MGSSQTRARTRVPCIGRQILNHHATREVPRPGNILSDLILDFRPSHQVAHAEKEIRLICSSSQAHLSHHCFSSNDCKLQSNLYPDPILPSARMFSTPHLFLSKHFPSTSLYHEALPETLTSCHAWFLPLLTFLTAAPNRNKQHAMHSQPRLVPPLPCNLTREHAS